MEDVSQMAGFRSQWVRELSHSDLQEDVRCEVVVV